MANDTKRDEMLTAGKRGGFHWFSVMLLTVVLVVSSSIALFMGYSKQAAERAVNHASLFYLEELASNVSQVFQTHFDGYLKELRLALLATKEAKPANREEFSLHLKSMADRGDFLFYALLDENGEVYISDKAYLSDFLKKFLLECDFNGDEITLEDNPETKSEDVFIIAQKAPEDIFINGKRIVAGAKGIAESKVRKEILLHGEDNTAFVHMIMSDGTYIISGDNEKLVHSENYFADLSDTAEFAEGDSLEKLIEDIQMEQGGSSAYYIDGVLHYCYYSFLPRSGWSIAVTVPFDTVSAEMQKTANMITVSGVMLILMVALLVSSMFFIYIRQKRVSMELDVKRLEAEERNKAKSSFLSSMSHDIRTPMNAIVGFTNLAMQQENSPRVQDYLTKISVSSNHLLSLINDVLDMSRIESGKMYIDEMKCNLSDILHELHTIIQGQVHEKQQHLYMDAVDVINEDVWCDKMRLNQMMLNFISNAVKFTPAGGTITVLISQKESTRPGYGTYEFRIKDTGIGMTPEFSKKVFEPFERERSSTVSEIQGTGLGMPIAKNIAEMMGGSVRVETELNKGTEFIVNLALRLQDESETVIPASVESLKGMRVLVIDEDDTAGDSIKKIFCRMNMDVVCTASRTEALRQMKQEYELGTPYQMIVVDWSLPDFGGVELVRELRTSYPHNIPILLVSSFSWSNMEVEAKDAGVTSLCNKPLFLSDMSELLTNVLGVQMLDEKTSEENSVSSFAGKRILLVDDNELNREIAQEILQGYDFVVETAEDGKMALDKVAASKPGYYDVVLMDVQMPVMDGHEATRQIRQLADPVLSQIPILAMTANAFAEDQQKALEVGMNGHLSKPIDVPKLLEMLSKFL
ncbi:MAG: response regulator [Oscillospiraceae bacterium]|nr:response regulator [Oscillospiraceae bacterium]